MKWIFFTLVALNLAILGAQQWVYHKRSGGQEIYEVFPDARPILLLNENMSGEKTFLERYSAPVAKSDERCYLIGPLSSRDVLEVFAADIGVSKADVRYVKNTVELAPGYRVYMGPFDQKSQLVTAVSRLAEKSVDNYVISSGRLKGAISLGVFDNIDSARNLMMKRQRQGYAVLMTEIKKRKVEYWMTLKASLLGVDSAVSGKIGKPGYETTEKRIISCKSVASSEVLS